MIRKFLSVFWKWLLVALLLFAWMVGTSALMSMGTLAGFIGGVAAFSIGLAAIISAIWVGINS